MAFNSNHEGLPAGASEREIFMFVKGCFIVLAVVATSILFRCWHQSVLADDSKQQTSLLTALRNPEKQESDGGTHEFDFE
jgi:hypothetical protein